MRPDNHVAWRSLKSVDDPAATLADALARTLKPRVPEPTA